jgi:predicted PurR-regulated permease PerM
LRFFTFVVAVIPGGPLLVAAPGFIWLFQVGSTWWAVFIAIWMVMVGSLDNFVRPFMIARGGGDIPLVLVIPGVLGGARAFGLIGLFLGPTSGSATG